MARNALKLSIMVGEKFEICISEMSRKILLVTKKGLFLGHLGHFRPNRWKSRTAENGKNEKPHYFFLKTEKTSKKSLEAANRRK